jgi:hypothetical protein
MQLEAITPMLAWLEETHLTQDRVFQTDPLQCFAGSSETILGVFSQNVFQWFQTIQDALKIALSIFSTCTHPHIQPLEGKSHCPDCGLGVVASWIILKCSGCDKRRDARLCFGQLWPHEKYCRDCGTQETYCHYLNPRLGVSYPYAWLVWESEAIYLERMTAVSHFSCSASSQFLSTQNKLRSKTPCQVWVEESIPLNPKDPFVPSVSPQGAAPNPFCLAMS